MKDAKRLVTIGSLVLVGLGVLSLAVDLVTGGTFNLSLPLVFLMLGGAFCVLVLPLSRGWDWAAMLYVPGLLLLALGVIFLLNVLTGDWNAWAYAWLLAVAGLGLGVMLAARGSPLPERPGRITRRAGGGTALAGVTLFALFGAIAGGRFILIMAPILLVLGGLALYWTNPHLVIPETLQRRPGISNLRVEPEQPVPGEKTRLAEPLSAREVEVLRLIEQGFSNGEIAMRLTLAPSTVKTHINNIYGKLGVQNRVQALNRAREVGLLRQGE